MSTDSNNNSPLGVQYCSRDLDEDGKIPAEFPARNDGVGWAIYLRYGSNVYYLPIRFARQQDAERARDALNPVLDWHGTRREVKQRMREFGLSNVRQVMLDAMAW